MVRAEVHLKSILNHKIEGLFSPHPQIELQSEWLLPISGKEDLKEITSKGIL